MNLSTLSYEKTRGWSVTPFPDSDSEHTLVLVFGAPEYGQAAEPIQALSRAYPHSRLVGCSTSGEILGGQIHDHTLAVSVLRFDRTTLQTASAPIASSEYSEEAGRFIGTQLSRADLRAVLVLSDGLRVNGSELVRGLNAVLPPSVVVTGGLAGDGDRFQQTWVLHAGRPQSGFVTAVGFYGDAIRVGHGSRGGWDIFGPERVVTKAQGNVLYELDGKPALDLYKEYLGERASGLPATALLFPLAIRAHAADQKSLVRTILAVNETNRSMTFAGNIPEGSLAQLMRANFDRLIQGASEAAGAARRSAPGDGPILSVAITCVGRRLVLGEMAEDETEASLEASPPQTQQIGFYSYGEISPFATGACDLHNQTMTITTLSEA